VNNLFGLLQPLRPLVRLAKLWMCHICVDSPSTVRRHHCRGGLCSLSAATRLCHMPMPMSHVDAHTLLHIVVKERGECEVRFWEGDVFLYVCIVHQPILIHHVFI
jgi:hypothetical protein